MNISKDDAISIIINFIYGDKLYPIVTDKKLVIGKDIVLRYDKSKFHAYPIAKYKVNNLLLSQWKSHHFGNGFTIKPKSRLYILRIKKVNVKDIELVKDAYEIIKKTYNCTNADINDCLTVKFLNS
jgi:hypothetical protein